MAKNIENGAESLRSISNVVAALAVIAFGLSLFLAFIGVISWVEFLIIAAAALVCVCARSAMLALATCADAAQKYLDSQADEAA